MDDMPPFPSSILMTFAAGLGSSELEVEAPYQVPACTVTDPAG